MCLLLGYAKYRVGKHHVGNSVNNYGEDSDGANDTVSNIAKNKRKEQ